MTLLDEIKLQLVNIAVKHGILECVVYVSERYWRELNLPNEDYYFYINKHLIFKQSWLRCKFEIVGIGNSEQKLHYKSKI